MLAHQIESGLIARQGQAVTNFNQALPPAQSDLDLRFYHLRLRCFVVIELKTGPFKPEYAGKMNFYLSAVDDLLRHADDQPTIGLILCKEKNRTIVEYALRDSQRPIGVSAYTLVARLPEPLQGSLPSAEALAAELAGAGEPPTSV